mgnify:CR=1 FL=1
MKRLCAYGRSTGTHGFFIYRIYTTRQVFNKKQYKGIALKCQKQYNIIGKNLVLLFNTEKLMNFVSVLSSALKKSDKTTTSLMDGYDEILLGFEMKK